MIRHGQQQAGFTLFELVVVSILIGIIVATGARYYAQAVDDSQRAGVELLSHRYTTVMALLHAQWIIEGNPPSVKLDGADIYFNPQGWPVDAKGMFSSSGVSEGSNDGKEGVVSGCYRLWNLALQNPAKLSTAGAIKGYRYHLTGNSMAGCRFNLITSGSENYYFEYFSSNGKVVYSTIPAQ
jgi:prepilin-type N-terminal cleavage/methylation domain-containing protein